ncbi:MAG: MG2 domain-containing protein [Bdellovibrionales bacterium]
MKALISLMLVTLFAHTTVIAATITRVSPQNLSNTANQIRVSFSDKMINLSAPSQNADLFNLNCVPQVQGRARWNDDKTWIFDFDTELEGNFLPGGTSCQIQLKKDVKSLAGASISGSTTFAFQIDGPNVLRVMPSSWSADAPVISEDQIFVLLLDTNVDMNTVLKNVYFEVTGKSSAVPVRLIEGIQRQEILKAEFGSRDLKTPVVLVQAREAFAIKSKVSLVWGPGIVASNGGKARQTKASYAFVVREELRAQFTCTRENAKADCSPLMPLEIEFSEPVSADLAKQVRLVGADGKVIHPDRARSNEKTVTRVTFSGPFKEGGSFKIEMPANMIDDSGRALSNSKMFPLAVKTAAFPPLAKFAANFGVIEASEKPNLLPATLRNLEAKVIGNYAGASVGGASVKLNANNFAEVIKWMQRLSERNDYEDRGKSLLQQSKDKKRFDIPLKNKGNTFEVVGIPLPGPGFYVVELESKILGNSLMGEDRQMYVPTGALVTNMAIHLKWGLESSLFWVTSLDHGRPVAGAAVRVHNCAGQQVWQGISDKDGLVRYPANLKNILKVEGCQKDGHYGPYRSGFFVTAQKERDFTFTHTGWGDGLEAYRFGNLPSTSPMWERSQNLAHTIFARTLLRAGETVHMKHLLRRPTSQGLLAVEEKNLPSQVIVEHQGSGAKYTLPLNWDKAISVAETVLTLPKDAKLGVYEVILTKNGGKNYEDRQSAGSFKVEEFKIPLMRAMISLPKQALVQPGQIEPQLTVAYQNGGPASNLDVVFRHHVMDSNFTPVEDYRDFDFMDGKVEPGVERSGQDNAEKKDEVITQKTKLSSTGAGVVKISGLSGLTAPKAINMEMEFRDANGEIQTVGRSATVWPSDLLLGLRSENWVAADKDIQLQAVVLDLKQRPVAGVAVSLSGFKVETYSHRKRLVGGFYAYEHVTETKPQNISANCSGVSDARGLVFCTVRANASGQLRLMAQAADSKGRVAFANSSVWLRGKDDFWFEAQDTDRIDLIPEQRRYEPGQTARLQVRMPFREATALVTTEREGVIDAKVVSLSGTNPVVEVPLKDSYAPNVFVSTFLVRGRMPDSEGEKYRPGQEFIVDLNKPAFKMGVAQLFVKWAAHELKVALTPNKEIYQPREEATVRVQVKDSKGKPAKGEFALAVVDEGLLQLQPNNSWNLLEAMMGRRPWGVQTSTAQMQVVGKRHFGQKAVAHGGDGGSQITRELFDTLVSWQGRVRLNEQGEATVKFKLNDSLTKFRVVAVAQSGTAQFGSGHTSISATQDLIAIPAQAQLARQGDKFSADMTVRNTTKKSIGTRVSGQVTFTFADGRKQVVQIGEKQAQLAAGSAQTLVMGDVNVPSGAVKAEYQYTVEGDSGQKDRMVISQEIKPLLVARTQMSQLEQLGGKAVVVGVERPQGADPSLGGVRVTLIDSLARGLESVKQYFDNYLCISLETLVSQAVATNDVKVWSVAMNKLSGQLDADGLLKWYPSAEKGSFDFTAYVLAIAKDAGFEIPQADQQRMLAALTQLAEGRLRRERLSDMSDRELLLRRISAMAALSRYDLAKAEWLKTLSLPPVGEMPTASLLDLIRVIYAVSTNQVAVEQSQAYSAAIRARLTLVGTRLEIAPDTKAIWWLLSSRAGSQSRLISLALSSPELVKAWSQDLPRLQAGLMNYLRGGAWDLPVTNAWSAVALRQFAKVIEAGKVSGTTLIDLAAVHKEVDWSKNLTGAVTDFSWPAGGAGQVTVSHRGEGKPWSMIATVAAVPPKPNGEFVGLQVRKSVKPVRQAVAGKWSRGDVIEVTLKVKGLAPTAQVALFDPIPSGAKILNSGLQAEDPRSTGWMWPDYDEKSYDGYRAIYGFIPTSEFEVIYRYQLNVSGTFNVPATRLEAMYTPETFAEIANGIWTVQP